MKDISLQRKVNYKILLVSIFGIAMGIFEAIVVIYLRKIYYPNGFDYAVVLLPQPAIVLELIREACTIFMLITFGLIVGKNALQRFAYFIFTFAIWDIFYYVGLKLLIDWPSTFLTWDILFLIPVPWIGPVLAPLISSLTMIFFWGSIIYFQEKGFTVKIMRREWGLIIIGALVILFSFMMDYLKIFFQEGNSAINTEHFLESFSNFQPTHFNWFLFFLGEIIIIFALFLVYKRTKSLSLNQADKS